MNPILMVNLIASALGVLLSCTPLSNRGSASATLTEEGKLSKAGTAVVQNTQGIYHLTISEDGSTDQTAIIQRQLDAVPDGTPNKPNVIKFPDGRYWTEGDLMNNPKGKKGIINLTNRHNLILEGGTFYTKAPATGYGGSVKQGDYSRRRHFWLIECSNVTLRNIRVEGSNTVAGKLIGTSAALTPTFWKGERDQGAISGSPAYRPYWEQEHAFDIRGCENVTIENCSVFGVWGDGVYVGGTATPSRNIVLKNLHLRFTGRQGIAAANNVDGLLIDKVWVDKGRRASIDLEPHSNDGFVRNVEIKNSKLEAVMTVIAAVGKGDVSNINIHDNTYRTTGHPLICYDSSGSVIRNNWTFKNNTRVGSFGSPIASIRFKKTNNIVIEGNTETLVHTQSQTTLSLVDCNNVKVVKNTFGHGKKIIQKNTTGIKATGNIPKQIIMEN